MPALDQINQGGTIYEIVPEIAELFKTTKAYHTGDHVIYEAGWYTFKADKSAGAWDATKVNGPFKVTDQLSDLKEELRKTSFVAPYNILSNDNIEEGRYYNLSGTHGTSSSYNCTKDIIPVSAGDVIRVYGGSVLGQGVRYITAYSDGVAVPADGVENTGTLTVTSGINGIRVSFYASVSLPMITVNYEAFSYQETFDPYYMASNDFLGDFAVGRSANALNPNTLTLDTYINNNGSSGASSSYAVTDYIPVRQGDVLTFVYSISETLTMRYVTAYNSQKKIAPALGAENVTSYTVPNDIAYVRITGSKAYITAYSARININGIDNKYQTYFFGTVGNLATQNYTQISQMYNYPLASMPTYMLGVLSYKPLAQLTKGYVCLVSDDGDAEVETYTIPMCVSKNVPCTLAMFKNSDVLQTSSGLLAVQNAVANNGFCVAQHGGENWTHFDEYTLNHFFEEEKAYWDSVNISIYGAVCPEHGINDMIKVVAGGRFGCVRTGYVNQYNNYNNGARSNLYGLSSQSVIDGGIDAQKTALDNALANKQLRIIHFHENELTTEHKATLEATIDYALSIGLEFVTMKDIPTLT